MSEHTIINTSLAAQKAFAQTPHVRFKKKSEKFLKYPVTKKKIAGRPPERQLTATQMFVPKFQNFGAPFTKITYS